jgi:hypothetical protein
MTSLRTLSERVLNAQIAEILSALSPAERLLLRARFDVGEVVGLSGEHRIGRLSNQNRDELERVALRKLRNSSLQMRDDSDRRPSPEGGKDNAFPWLPPGGGPADLWPPADDSEPEQFDVEFWDEA